ncbi:heparan sulfate glucosamine 3-O-sulfotransferase 1-like [Ptychodera flava]|uniref:heparan sulfate glucosamine 3-O-sulfotransferase 1-like n=1 Tax=Ptychodera flava TaxID=63121 RepID=UPI00396A2943
MGTQMQSIANLVNFLCNYEGRRSYYSLPAIAIVVVGTIILISASFHTLANTPDRLDDNKKLLNRIHRIVLSPGENHGNVSNNLHVQENLHATQLVLDLPKMDLKNISVETDNIFLKDGTLEDVFLQVHNIYRTTCYWLDKKSKMWGLRQMPALKKRGCEQKLPNVVVVGAKKCGTTALTLWLSTHPLIAAVTAEKHYFDEYPDRSLEWYRRKMPFSTEIQITMETTPKYFVFPENVPERIHNEISPKTKIILILCDPVGRAVSDYTHEFELNKTTGFYKIRDTFAASVLREDGSIDADNELIDTGIYVKHLKRWLKYFPEIFVVDGTSFKQSNPAPTLIRAEKFLGLPRFFEEWQFYVNSNKGNYCSKLSFPMHCLGANKGRKHPEIDESILEKVRAFYQPYNLQASQLLNRDFTWD